MMSAARLRRASLPALSRACSWALSLVLPLWLVACAGVMGPRTVLVPEAEIARRVSTGFPLRQALPLLGEVEVAAPRLRLLPEAGRLALELDLRLSDAIRQQTRRGHAALDFRLGFDAAQQAVTLDDVRVGAIEIEGMGPRSGAMLSQLGDPLLGRALQGRVVYRLKPEDVERVGRTGYEVERLSVTAQGIEIRLLPRPPAP